MRKNYKAVIMPRTSKMRRRRSPTTRMEKSPTISIPGIRHHLHGGVVHLQTGGEPNMFAQRIPNK